MMFSAMEEIVNGKLERHSAAFGNLNLLSQIAETSHVRCETRIPCERLLL